jgi:hypothetical protein
MRNRLKWMALGALALLAAVYVGLIAGGGAYFDSICVEGRLSYEQVEAINSLSWDRCPKYRQSAIDRGEYGQCKADVRDRVIVRECSEFFRSGTLRDIGLF